MSTTDRTPAVPRRFLRQRRVLLLLLILPVGILASQLLFPGRHTAHKITIALDTNGCARVFGFPLHNKRLRNGAFRTLATMGLKAEIRMPGGIPSPGSFSNILDTLQAASSANLLPTNSSRTVFEFSYE